HADICRPDHGRMAFEEVLEFDITCLRFAPARALRGRETQAARIGNHGPALDPTSTGPAPPPRGALAPHVGRCSLVRRCARDLVRGLDRKRTRLNSSHCSISYA